MDPNRPKQDLREIGHLFLSGVRERQTGNAPRPVRVSPRQRMEQPVELTPEELAGVAGEIAGREMSIAGAAGEGAPEPLRVTCLLGVHLGAKLHDRAALYASAVAAGEDVRVGLVELDTSGTRITLLEPGVASLSGSAAESLGSPDGGAFAPSLEELAWDVQRWVVVLPNPRTPEARAIVHAARDVTLLADADADGAVAAYRSLKGLADLLRRDGRPLPRLTLSLPATPPHVAEATRRKLAGVCEQFLHWPITAEPNSTASPARITATVAFADAAAPSIQCWDAVASLVGRGVDVATAAAPPVPASEADADVVDPIESAVAERLASPPPFPEPSELVEPAAASQDDGRGDGDDDDIIDLPTGATAADGASIVSAVLSGSGARWVACPVAPPMCPAAKLAVARDRTLTLLAAVGREDGPGGRPLASLRSAVQAYEWLKQNRSLVAMALPQFAIDAHALPRLTLLIDHADASAAEELRPLLAGASHVSVITYRKLRWGGRAGLLLDAA